jgi:hypothetical protein
MEDALNYMNSVSEASQALNQVTALRQEAEMQFQQKKEQLGQELELPSELTLTAAGSYLGKKVLGYVGEKFGSTISDVAGQVGISQETVGKALSGDISGALEQGAQEVSTAVSGAVESAVGQAQEMVGGLVEEGTGILGRISGALENIPSLTPSSIMPDIDIGNIYNQGLEDLRAQAGIDENIFRDFTNVSIENSRPFSFNTPQPTEIEMTDFSNIATPATEATTTAEASTAEAVSTAGTAGEAGAVATAETVGEVAGAEAVGAGLDVTGVLAPIGALVGLIGGIVGFFEGHHQEAETMSEAPTPILNPSSQFL